MFLWSQPWPFLALVFIITFVWVAYSEFKSQDCLDLPCLNTTPAPNDDDTPIAIIDKLITTLRVNHSPVGWRQAALAALSIAFLILVVFSVTTTFRNYALVVLIVFIFVYAALAWTVWAYWRPINIKVEKELADLKVRLQSSL